MVINNIFEIGQTVYLKTDKEQAERLVVGILVRPEGLLYDLAYGSQDTRYFREIEISLEKDVLITTTN